MTFSDDSQSKLATLPQPERVQKPEVLKNRRQIVKKLAVGTAALAGCSVLPGRWTTPLVEFGTLPAHATTSSALVAMIEEVKSEVEAKEAAEKQAAAEEQAANDELRGYSNKLTINNTGDKVSIDSIWQDKFRFPKLGPDYGRRFLLVWSDGRELDVPDSSHMTMLPPPDGRKFQPGGPYSGNNPDIPTMEVYAAIGTHPASVTLYY